jgi:hypothetical protein
VCIAFHKNEMFFIESSMQEMRDQMKALRTSLLKGVDSAVSNTTLDSLRSELSIKERLLAAREDAVNELTDNLHREKATSKRLRADLCSSQADLTVTMRRQSINENLLLAFRNQLNSSRGVIAKIVSSVQKKSAVEEGLRAAHAAFRGLVHDSLQVLSTGLEHYTTSCTALHSDDSDEIDMVLEGDAVFREQLVALESAAHEELAALGLGSGSCAAAEETSNLGILESSEALTQYVGTQVATDQQSFQNPASFFDRTPMEVPTTSPDSASSSRGDNEEGFPSIFKVYMNPLLIYCLH